MLRKFVLVLLLVSPLVAHAGLCKRTWDGDRLATMAAGQQLGQSLRLSDHKGEVVATVTAGQIKAFHVAKEGIARAANRSPSLIVCDSVLPNAFASPGKSGDIIGVTVGMLKLVDGDRDMAATVIGHEYAHHTRNHVHSAQARNMLFNLLGMAIGLAIESRIPAKSKLSGYGFGLDLGQLGAGLVARKYDRDQERDADEVGFDYLLKAGFDPLGAVRLAEQMKRHGHAGSGLFYDTHPGWEERIERFKDLAANHPRPANAAPTALAKSVPETTKGETGALALLTTYEATDAQQAYVEAVAAFQRKELQEGVRHLRAAANAGYAPAQAVLGYLYVMGVWGLAQDDREAIRLFQLAAEQGDAFGQANLGYMYSTGHGVDRNAEEALRLYRLAAEQENPLGLANLGMLYLYGIGGVAKDEQEALRLFRTGAEKGGAQARSNLATMYQAGLGGLNRDEAEALRLYRLAAEEGNANAQANLGIFNLNGQGGLEKNEAEALRYLKLAVARRSGLAQANLGYLYQTGKAGLTRDSVEAVRLYKLAAAQGNPVGKNNLAQAYEFGIGGLDKNLPAAIALYKEAAATGSANARKNLARLGVQQ